MKKEVFLLASILVLTHFFLIPTIYASSPEADGEVTSHIQNKFEPWLWDKIQALKSNGTTSTLSLIIRLTKGQHATDAQIEELKNYVTSVLSSNHSATVYSAPRVLPIIMAKVPVAEVQRIAEYQFVESIGDGDKVGSIGLSVSRSAIKADSVKALLGYGGNGIKIAILDSGINSSHPDLDDLDDDPATFDPKVIVERSFVDLNDDNITDEDSMDYLGHGTFVAGITAGTGVSSNYLYVGVAPGAWLMNIKISYIVQTPSGPRGTFETDDLLNGIGYAISQGADVIGLSLGGTGGVVDGNSELAKAADDAVERGIVVVALAGNIDPSVPSSQKVWTPGDAFNVITVGACDDHNTIDVSDDTLATFSSHGPTDDGRPKPDVVAPGVNIIAPMSRDSALWQADANARRGDFYCEGSGTSASVPHVSGAVALMLEANPNLTPAQVKAILRQTARLNDNLDWRGVNDRGYGIIDAHAAVQLAQNVPNIDKALMYDSWNVRTPVRLIPPLRLNEEYLTFRVVGPAFGSGIGVYWVDYHFIDISSLETSYSLLRWLSAQHVWLDGTYYDLGRDMSKYLVSGPRVYEKGEGYVLMGATYKVANVFVGYLLKMDVDEMWLKLFILGASYRVLLYIDPDVWGSSNYAKLPSTNTTILTERTIYGDVLLDVRHQNRTEHLEIDPVGADNPRMWVLKSGYYGNNPDSVLNGDYLFNRDVVIYYQATSYPIPLPDPGPNIRRKPNPPDTPDTSQDDARTRGDAGNNFNDATRIFSGTYKGILSESDPEDTKDWYKFYARSEETIEVDLQPPVDIDFDLELYDPQGNLKAASYEGAGCLDSVTYNADSEGYWRARINRFSGEAEYDFSIQAESASGGGCPILYVYNGGEYFSEGLLDIHDPNGTDVITKHTLITAPERINGEYLFRLTEHPKTISHIDQVKFYAILKDKTLLELSLTWAIHSEHGDVLQQLLLSDEWKTETLGADWNNGASQSINLKFQALPQDIKPRGFMFQIEGNNMIEK